MTSRKMASSSTWSWVREKRKRHWPRLPPVKACPLTTFALVIRRQRSSRRKTRSHDARKVNPRSRSWRGSWGGNGDLLSVEEVERMGVKTAQPHHRRQRPSWRSSRAKGRAWACSSSSWRRCASTSTPNASAVLRHLFLTMVACWRPCWGWCIAPPGSEDMETLQQSHRRKDWPCTGWLPTARQSNVARSSSVRPSLLIVLKLH